MADNGTTVGSAPQPTGPGSAAPDEEATPTPEPAAASATTPEEPEPESTDPAEPADPADPAVAAEPGAKTAAALARLRQAVPSRFGRPMVVTAAAAGALLVTLPFLFTGSEGSPAQPNHPVRADRPVGPDGSQTGFVPGLAAVPSGAPSGSPTTSALPALPVGDSTGGGVGGTAQAGNVQAGNTQGGSGPLDVPVRSGTGGNPAPGTGGNPAPNPAPTPTATRSAANPAPAAAKPPVYSAVTGPGCSTWGYQQTGYYTKGKDGWRSGSGAWSQDGCNGSYSAMPLHGDTNPDPAVYSEWLFSPNLSVSTSCTLLVYIPRVSDLTMVGGKPAYYTVYRAFTPSANNVIGSFQINQGAHLGQWVTAGTYPARAKLAVGLDNRGIDWGSGNLGRHVAAAQVKAVCRG